MSLISVSRWISLGDAGEDNVGKEGIPKCFFGIAVAHSVADHSVVGPGIEVSGEQFDVIVLAAGFVDSNEGRAPNGAHVR